jgi:hypothetical protein
MRRPTRRRSARGSDRRGPRPRSSTMLAPIASPTSTCTCTTTTPSSASRTRTLEVAAAAAALDHPRDARVARGEERPALREDGTRLGAARIGHVVELHLGGHHRGRRPRRWKPPEAAPSSRRSTPRRPRSAPRRPSARHVAAVHQEVERDAEKGQAVRAMTFSLMLVGERRRRGRRRPGAPAPRASREHRGVAARRARAAPSAPSSL